MKISKDTIIRTVVLILALANQVLIMLGKNQLPWTEDELYQGVSAVVTVIASVWGFWKNNSFTNEAQQADKYLEELRNGNTK